MVTIYCRSFASKNETDFTSILLQYLCKMADLITKSGDIWVHQLPPQTVRNPDLLCGFWPDSVYYVAKSSSLIPKVAVHVRDFGRHEWYHECSISTHQYPPQSVRITLEILTSCAVPDQTLSVIPLNSVLHVEDSRAIMSAPRAWKLLEQYLSQGS